MKLLLLRDWVGLDKKDPEPRQHYAGQFLSVSHFSGMKLLKVHAAKWFMQESGDPEFPDGRPAEPFCATLQERQLLARADTMVHKAMNK